MTTSQNIPWLQEIFRKNNNSIFAIKTFVILAFTILALPIYLYPQASASTNYSTQTGNIGTTYSWIDCSGGTSIVTGDDKQASIAWPFNFSFYNNNYTTANSLSVATNGFIRLDGVAAGGNYSASSSYNLTSSATNFGQIISMAMYDCYVGRIGTSWVRYLVTGTAPFRVLTIEYNNLSIPYSSSSNLADVQVSFYESLNKVVLKLGNDDITTNGADMGIHSGVAGYYHKWQEVATGTNNTWIEYTPPIKVIASSGSAEAYYSSVKAAFDKVNDGTHQGNISIMIQESTVETACATLNASGSGSANYATINIYPTKTGLSVIGNLATPLIDFNGADNVTIDGRVNATGSTKDLQIINTSTSSIAGISTIRLINDASNNTVKYCTIKGSETRSSGGVIYFATTTASSGNDNNIISNNNITSSTDANRPVNAIYSEGTNGKDNDNNTISNNYIYDFFKHASASNGVHLYSNSTEWTISGNSFYETTNFASTATVTYNAIKIDNSSGNNFSIIDNYIGGSEALCAGTAMTKSNSANNHFNAIYLNAGSTVESSVQNNTIKNINWSNSSNATWTGINIAAGNANIGTIAGNTIGESTGNGAITITAAVNGQNVFGIYISSDGITNCKNNTIGSITSSNQSTLSSNIIAINNTGTTGTTVISHNTIGSTSTSNSIYASSTSSSNPQTIIGISNSNSGNVTISSNTIANLTNAATSLSSSSTVGINATEGSNSILYNTIFNISSASRQPGTGYSASVIGICQRSNISGTTQNIESNVVYNLNNTNASSRVELYGIYYEGPTSGTHIINGNFIHSLSISSTHTSSVINGIYLYDGLTTSSNNIISLGTGISTGYKINGIWDNSGATNNNKVYFNTIYLAGSVIGTTSTTSALANSANTSTCNYRNNIFVNARSGGSGGSHYAISLSGTSNLTIDYNDYWVTGTGGILAYLGGDLSTLANLQSATGQDSNSLNTDPAFTNAGGTINNDYYAATDLNGVDGTGITTEFFGVSRLSPPKMGAFEADFFVWQGNTSTDFATASNWANGIVPPSGADINFAADPSNHCVLDQNRTVKNIINTQNTDMFVVNGHQLTITGNLDFSNGAQIDVSAASSKVVFAGNEPQTIPTNAFVSNSVQNLTVNNIDGVTQNGDLTIVSDLSLTNGVYSLGANTITINGTITKSAGSLLGGEATNLVIGGNGTSTTIPAIDLHNLVINRANGVTAGGNIHVNGLLTLTNGTLIIGSADLLLSGSSPVRTNGNIDVSNTLASVSFANELAIILVPSLFSGAINNINITGAGGITSQNDLTVNGIMNISAANPSSIKGALDMLDGVTIKTLNMGATATNTGDGDVTGIIRRTTILAGTIYTFGHPKTTGYFPNEGTLPTEISAKVSIGTTPSWRSSAINREIEIIQTGGSSTKAMFTCHYLDSELNGNSENNLVWWTKYLDLEYGRSGNNTSENWVSLSNVNVAFFPSSFDNARNLTLDVFSNVTTITWNGSLSDSWTSVENWTPNSGPSAVKNIIIPDAATTPNDPKLPAVTEVKSITIQANGILNANDGAVCTVNGDNGAWINTGGTLNPNNSTIIFNNANATISGETNFYNLTIDTGAALTLNNGGTIRIGGTITNSGVLHTVVGGTTIVEYNGGDQTVVIPNAATNRYHCLILSGSGTKTLPSTAMNIVGNLSIIDGVSTTAAAALTINDRFLLGTGANFSTGAFDHSIGGDIDISGTLTFVAGQSITLNGTTTQSIMGSSNCSFEKLTINNSNGVTIYSDIEINDLLTLSSGILNVENTTLTINNDILQTSGYLGVNSSSSLYFGGTTALNTTGLFSSTPVLNSLTVNRTGGVVFGSDLTVNGVLHLQTANPSSTMGSLHMGSNTLTMNENAVNTGIGDVTGKIKRNSFSPNIEYTFGNPSTSVTFPDIGTLPSEIILKIDIGVASSWKPDGILRVMDISQIGGSETRAIVKSHYLDSELNGNTESNISFFSYIYPSTTLLDRGLSEINTSENWITLNNSNFSNLPSAFGVIEHTFGVSTSDVITWDGSESSDWFDQYNWTPAIAPDLTKKIVIPDAATTPNDPTITNGLSSTIKTLAIHEQGVLNAGTSSVLTLVGTSGVWSNYGTFNASTGKVIFSHGVISEIVTISGETNFYDFEVGPNTTFQPVAGNVLRIAGVGSIDPTSLVDFSTINSTVEWNGADQTIVNPIGIGSSSGYYHLIIGGSGIKTMPNTIMNINGNLNISGTASATADESIIIAGNLSIGNGASFETGNFNHSLSGDFENNGSFSASSGAMFTFDGSSIQTLSGTSITNFDIFNIDNANGVSLSCQINVDNELILNNGNLSINANILGINGIITQTSGYIETTTSSSISFGGTTALALSDYLFSSTPSINNLSLNRSGGVSLGLQDISINGTLTLTDGTLNLGSNTLNIAGSSPVRTSGNINASNTSAGIEFSNSSAITIPSSFFTGSVNNFTVSGSGGVSSNGDFEIGGILELSASNPSSSKGLLDMGVNTLSMGVNSTTTGIGDVTGIVKRQHTFTDGVEYSFGNQYTTLNFIGIPSSTKPGWISCRIELGTAPVWRATNVKRIYSFAQEAGGNDRAYTKLHYLDSELDASETVEGLLTIWNDYDGVVTGDNTFVNGKTTQDSTTNWIELLGMATDFIAPSTSFAKQYAIGYSDVTTITWTGLGSASYPGDWSLPGHWSGGIPTAEDDVLIPASLPVGSCGYPDTDLLINIQAAQVKTIEIEAGASLDASNFDLTVYGDSNAWVNNGTFIPGNKTVYFSNGLLTSTVEISGTTQFNNLYITDKTNIVPQTGSSISIKGDLTCDGTISDINNNTIVFNGNNGNQNISGTGDLNFYNMVMNNTSPGANLNVNMPVDLSNVLTLTSNNIVTTNVNYILMGASSSVSPDGGDATSFIDGPLYKLGNTAFVFPIGSGSTWAPIGIEAPENSSTISAEHFLENGPYNWSGAYMCTGSDMLYSSGVEYWELTTTDSHPGVTLYWKSTESGIVEPSYIIVSHYNGTCWENMGGTATGDATSGSISSTVPFTSYSPITFATKGSINPLPVSLLQFEANCLDNKVELNWSTASEINNKIFEIEISYNTQDWKQIGAIFGKGNSNNINLYSFSFKPENDLPAYFRLVQIDFDGQRTELAIQHTDCSFSLESKISLKPNPASGFVSLVSDTELLNESYTLTNSMGQVVVKGIANGYETEISLVNLKPGIYYIVLPDKNEAIRLTKF